MNNKRSKEDLKATFVEDVDAWETPELVHSDEVLKPIPAKKPLQKRSKQIPKKEPVKSNVSQIKQDFILDSIEGIRNIHLPIGPNQHRVVIDYKIFEVFNNYCMDNKDRYAGSFINKILYTIAMSDKFKKYNKDLHERAK
jgi:hypothetical protein